MIDLSGIQLVMFDADGTLRRCTVPGQPCPNRKGEWELLPNVSETIRGVPASWLGIASNQGGVGLGMMSAATAMGLLVDLIDEMGFNAQDFDPQLVIMCPHAPRAGCDCRKPKPGMLLEALQITGVRPDEALFVGDQDTDRQAAATAGYHFAWAHEFFGWEKP